MIVSTYFYSFSLKTSTKKGGHTRPARAFGESGAMIAPGTVPAMHNTVASPRSRHDSYDN